MPVVNFVERRDDDGEQAGYRDGQTRFKPQGISSAADQVLDFVDIARSVSCETRLPRSRQRASVCSRTRSVPSRLQ